MQHHLNQVREMLLARLADSGKGGSWSEAEADALLLLWGVCTDVLQDRRVQRHLTTLLESRRQKFLIDY